MPPHCDTMDGPVVKAARNALETGKVNLILPWAPKSAEGEIRNAFDRTLSVRRLGSREASELADRWFFETVVRLHRAGEGAPYTGLKPAGLDEGPVVPLADKAIEKGNPKEVVELLQRAVEEEVQKRFRDAMSKKKYDENNVGAAREYVEAMLGFILYSHKLHAQIRTMKEHGGEERHADGGRRKK